VLTYGALVESLASEQAARMVAMKSATDSASDMIDSLTRDYNRVRQTAITTQLLEVVSGAEALEE
jgi:F-type H+-transporting ATPase subunit gamma